MWQPDGKQIDPAAFGRLEPVEPLFEFEGEILTFVSREPDEGLLLAHNLCVFDATSRYIVSAIDPRLLRELKAGRLDILSALRQPRCWIADIRSDPRDSEPWRIVDLHRVDFESVPKDHLPRAGAMISPELDPIFTIRLIGPGVGPGKTTVGDVRMAANAAEAGLRGLARIALDEEKKAGRTPRTVRDFSDLPFQYSRSASFEIAFGRPQDRFPEVDDVIFDKMGRLLKEGLDAIRSDEEESVRVEGLNETQTVQLYEAIKSLTPPPQGGVVRIELGGGLTERLADSKLLTRDDRLRSNQRIKGFKRSVLSVAPFQVTGVAEAADKGLECFILRKLVPAEIPGVGALAEITFSFDDHLYEKVSDAWNSEDRVMVVGQRFGEGYKALDIQDSIAISNPGDAALPEDVPARTGGGR